MAGQSVIIATGAIEYPAEYQSIAPAILPQLGISKAITISSTYDHRIIQGAESGAFLARVHELLIGKDKFYEQIFADLGIAHAPLRWNVDRNPLFAGADQTHEQSIAAGARDGIDQRLSRARPSDRRHRSAARDAAALSSGTRHRNLRPDDLGSRSHVHHRRSGRH